jgi:hypothetical protein
VEKLAGWAGIIVFIDSKYPYSLRVLMVGFVIQITLMRANAIKKPGTETGLTGIMHSLSS